MLRLAGVLESPSTCCWLSRLKTPTMAGRAVHVFSRAEAWATPPFYSNINRSIRSQNRMPPVRWQQTASQTQGNGNVRVGQRPSRAGWFLGGASAVSVIGGALKYVYENTPSDKWPDWIRKVLEVRKQARKDVVDQAYEDLTFAKEILGGVERLGKLKDGRDFESSFTRMIQGVEKRLQEKQGAIEVEKEARKKDQTNHERLVEQLTKDHREVLVRMQREHEAAIPDFPKFKLRSRLYDLCPTGNSKCLTDLHKYLSGSGTIAYTGEILSSHFMNLLGQALGGNINDSVTEISFLSSNIRDGFSYITDGLKQNATIRSLNLGKTDLGVGDFMSLKITVE